VPGRGSALEADAQVVCSVVQDGRGVWVLHGFVLQIRRSIAWRERVSPELHIGIPVLGS
jgi:hypothetical protein